MPFKISEIVIWPISLVNGSTVFYITSQIVKSDSILHLMINLKHPDKGYPMYSSCIYSTICTRCKIQGLKDCKHDIFMPSYFDPERALMAKLLMQSKSNDVYQREIRNEFVEASLKNAFDPRSVNALLDPTRDYSDKPMANELEVYIVVDPCAGGKSSRYAIISFITPTIRVKGDIYNQKNIVILGAENCEEREPHIYKSVLIEHMENIRKIPGLLKCVFVIMPESNFALESSNILDVVAQKYRRDEYFPLMEDGDRPGFRTDLKLKDIGTNLLKEFLTLGYIRFHSHFFTSPMGENLNKYLVWLREDTQPLAESFIRSAINEPNSKARNSILEIAKTQVKEEIVNQLNQWKEEIRLDKDGNAKRFYSGKYGGKQDDLSMCCVAAVIMIKRWQNTVDSVVGSVKEGDTGSHASNVSMFVETFSFLSKEVAISDINIGKIFKKHEINRRSKLISDVRFELFTTMNDVLPQIPYTSVKGYSLGVDNWVYQMFREHRHMVSEVAGRLTCEIELCNYEIVRYINELLLTTNSEGVTYSKVLKTKYNISTPNYYTFVSHREESFKYIMSIISKSLRDLARKKKLNVGMFENVGHIYCAKNKIELYLLFEITLFPQIKNKAHLSV